MPPTEYPPVDWAGRGYHGFPAPPSRPAADDRFDDPWWVWATALHRARAGDFSAVPDLLRVLDEAADPVLLQSCGYLLGDAGPGRVFPAVRLAAREAADPDLAIWCGNALMEAGRLSDVPLLLDLYEADADNPEAVIFAVYLSDLLEEGADLSDPDAFPSPAEYRAAVTGRFREVADALGTDDVLVYQGQPFGVVPFARRVLAALRQPHFRMSQRRRFEASTGIDCSAFYQDRRLQPLAAAAVVEEFLDSPETAKYEDGVRYFFGHRIPD